MVQWLRLHAPNAGDMGSIPGQGTKIQHVTQCSQGEKKISLLILKALFLSILASNHTDKKYQVNLIFIS